PARPTAEDEDFIPLGFRHAHLLAPQGPDTSEAPFRQTTLHASSKLRRGARGNSLLASPYPRLQRKLDLTFPAKNSASTFALLKPDIGPQSSPSARAASMKYAPWSEPFRSATYSSTFSGRSLNHALASACG